MTALSDFIRLESEGLWRASPEAQRRDVIVSFGNATLVLSDKNDTALTHWSLPAIQRLNPGERPAIFTPDADASETLEIDDETMIQGIEKIRTAVSRRRSQPGRLRFLLIGGFVVGITALSLFWLPNALTRYTASLVPASKRADIGETLLTSVARATGKACTTPFALRALKRLETRLLGADNGRLVIVPSVVRTSAHLPGGYILLGRNLVEDYDSAEVVAGFILAEQQRWRQTDPLEDLLRASGVLTSFKFLTTGEFPQQALERYAETMLTKTPVDIKAETLLSRFAEAGIPSSPYAFAMDVSGETTLTLIEADPFPNGMEKPVLSDGDWVSLQGICQQ